MSSTPPSGPPTPPPGGETLEQGSGQPVPPSRGSGGGKRLAVLGVGGVAALALVGGGAWAAMSFLGSGDQPAQALPASTIGYLSVDLDPSGEQKLEALRTLEKFPAFTEQTDISSSDDLRRELGEHLIAESDCDLDYDDDVAPWIGDRFAVAAIDLGEDTPSPVGVAQVTDAGAAEDGLAAISECGGESSGIAVEGDWAVLAETQELADQVVSETADGSLADDEDFTRWSGEAGEEGIVAGYLAPEAGPLLAELSQDLAPTPDDLGAMPGTELGGVPQPGLPPELATALEDFQGAAMAVRFADGAVEVETAADAGDAAAEQLIGTSDGAAAMATLPEDTVAAFGLGFEEGWFTAAVEYLDQTLPEEAGSVTDQVAMIEEATGLDLPGDAEALLGDSAVLALGGDADLSEVFASEDLSALPVALKVQGDPDEVEGVLDTLRGADPAAATFLQSEADGDMVAIGPNPDHLAAVSGDGGLGDSALFQDVVREADEAGGVLFVDFDAVEDIAGPLSGDDPMVTENLEPLAGLGFSGWLDGEVSHAVLRVTTD